MSVSHFRRDPVNHVSRPRLLSINGVAQIEVLKEVPLSSGSAHSHGRPISTVQGFSCDPGDAIYDLYARRHLEYLPFTDLR